MLATLQIKVKKGLSLETKNTQNYENRRLGLIESLQMQHCGLRGCISPPRGSAPLNLRFLNSTITM